MKKSSFRWSWENSVKLEYEFKSTELKRKQFNV